MSNTAAAAIATELSAIVTVETLQAYIDDETGADSLEQYADLVAARLGRDYDETAWGAAMDLLRAGACVAADGLQTITLKPHTATDGDYVAVWSGHELRTQDTEHKLETVTGIRGAMRVRVRIAGLKAVVLEEIEPVNPWEIGA